MGFGLPSAIGAQVARPDAIVVDIDGDGSFLMNIQELATLHAEDIPVKMMILNNQYLGMVVQWEDRFYKANRAHTFLGSPSSGVCPPCLLLRRALNQPHTAPSCAPRRCIRCGSALCWKRRVIRASGWLGRSVGSLHSLSHPLSPLGSLDPLTHSPPHPSSDEYHVSGEEADIFPDFVAISKGFRVPAKRVTRRCDLKAAIEEMINTPGPYLLDVMVPRQAHVLPMIPGGGSFENIITTGSGHDDF
jgi:hypothetical protein